MGEKVRILGIAPYKGLVTLMKRYAGQRDDIQLTAMLGNVETGLSLAKEHYRNYDITKKGSVQHSANTVFMGKVQSLHAN